MARWQLVGVGPSLSETVGDGYQCPPEYHELGYDSGDVMIYPLFFTAPLTPLARVTLSLTKDNTLGDVFSAAWLIVVSRNARRKTYNRNERIRPQKEQRVTYSTIVASPPKASDFVLTNVSWLFHTMKDAIGRKLSTYFFGCKGLSIGEVGEGAEEHTPYFRRYDREELVSKPAIS